MISWLSHTTLPNMSGPADLLYLTLRRSGPFFLNMLHNFLFKLLFCPDWTIAMLSWQVFQQLIQKMEARNIFNELKRTHVTPLFINLYWLPIAAHIKFKTLIFAYRTTSGSAPLYLNSLLQTCLPSRSLRSAYEQRISLPSQRGTKSLSQTFSLTVPIWWNDLPNSIWAAESLPIFKNLLNTHIFHLYSTL